MYVIGYGVDADAKQLGHLPVPPLMGMDEEHASPLQWRNMAQHIAKVDR